MNLRERSRAGGFTLIEVLVALVIVAFGMGALMASLTSAADAASHLRDKSFAEWIALNRISELRLRAQPPPEGEATGEVEYAGTRWRWTQDVSRMEYFELVRIDVSVSPLGPNGQAAGQLAQASGFYGGAIRKPDELQGADWSLGALRSAYERDEGQRLEQDGQPGPGRGGESVPAPSRRPPALQDPGARR